MRIKKEIPFKRLRIYENIRPLNYESLAKLVFSKKKQSTSIQMLSRWNNGYCLTAVNDEVIEKLCEILKVDKDNLIEYKDKCDVCGSYDIKEAPHLGKNCNDCNHF